VKRIDILYGGVRYSLGNRELEDVQRELAANVAAGLGWFTVNYGDGGRTDAILMITPGVDLTLIPIDPD
jgi:hypothetical protein